GFVLYGSLVLLPIWMQTLLGYPAVVAGIALAPRGLGSFLAMPVVGSLLSRLDPRKFLALGLLVAALTLVQLGRLDLNAGYWDFFWPQFVQGISLALLFVPLTTVSMGLIPKEQMGNATSIFNLLRNTGGSVGIATVTTLVSRYSQAHINTLAAHVTPYDGVSRGMLEGLTQGMMAQGSAPAVAAKQGYAALFGMVQRQATILSFLDVFWLLGLIFLGLVPLVMLMRRPAKGGGSVAAH
ncbi:MAG: MFS transporter, partial [Bryobacterales bacterium]|nr:MFS transporter [Bryobacterales bacterium]